ncbi:Vegetative incompatibility protein HET-E-1 [Penicillium subrubescens]|uniref:Vegetative incompatibility protein HET-E-1 n=1 Tax=Penicillium subrubescens TaxID=1316194 RepID=A0A1Q5UB81_9EURO|nr:Vegetative incompatibility protein HET-E-1 [Penicillium subrubescens]
MTAIECLDQKIDLGKLPVVQEAAIDSFANQHEDECLRGTRTRLLKEIGKWAKLLHGKCIFWLKGMAGTGKSTISRTVARSLKDTNNLGASFFFKRGDGNRGNAKKLFTTLTTQLMLRIPELRSGVQKALHDDPDIASKSLREQFEKLLLQPLLYLDQLGRQPRTAVIVIDALDECDHDQDIQNIIRLLPLLQKAKAVCIRIFLTSRPELPISIGFSEIADHEYQDLALHEIPEEMTEHDIHLFLQHRFAKIKRDRNISQAWPGDDVIQKLVTMSVPLFISAATVCRYIENSKWEPKSRLAELLTDQAKYVSRMDKTYLPILTRLLDDQESNEFEQRQLMQEFQSIVGAIIILTVPLSINALSPFLGISADQVSNRLDSFRSVLSVPNDRDQPIADKAPLQLYVAGLIFIPETSITRKLFKAEIPPWISQIPRVEERWSAELQTLEGHSGSVESVAFSPNGLLLASASFDKTVRLWSPATGALQQTLEGKSHGIRSVAFSPDGRLLASGSFDKTVRLWNPSTGALQQTLKGHSGPIWSVAFSPDGRRLASGSADRIVRLWDTESGALQQILAGRFHWIKSLAFSPDGRLLASGSDDKVLHLWDPKTGALQQTLKGQSQSTWSVAFSPDSRMLASGSADRVVRLWDPATGVLQMTLEGHLSSILSVAFSPDGRLLASGSDDKTVRLWNPSTGALQQTLAAYSGSIRSLAFSPDSRLLASGSYDKIVRLWDPTACVLQQTFEGRSHSIRSIAFSPDSRLLASCSDDKTVCLWDPATGALQRTLEGHSLSIRSIAFSPDGRLLASCSYDMTIRVWDPATGAIQHTLEGHSQPVMSVAFAPDGRLLASGSDDKTVRLWDTKSGTLQQTLEDHSHSTWSVAFSPDGRLLASGSSHKIVCLWDPATGALLNILEGHFSSILSVAFSPDSRLLASCSDDKTVCLWDTESGALQQTINASGA